MFVQPPKELFIEVRAVRDCGELLTYYGTLKLDRDTTHFARRYDTLCFICICFYTSIYILTEFLLFIFKIRC
jgi:hypothetical protein